MPIDSCNQNSAPFLKAWGEVIAETRELCEKWKFDLRSKNIRAAQLLNGWVRGNKIQLVNYWFNDGVNVGDRIAIGDYKEYEIVQIVAEEKNMVSDDLTYTFTKIF